MTDMMPTVTFDAVADDGDRALARLASGGDMLAFEALYRRHVGRVLGVITRLVGSIRSPDKRSASGALRDVTNVPRVPSTTLPGFNLAPRAGISTVARISAANPGLLVR